MGRHRVKRQGMGQSKAARKIVQTVDTYDRCGKWGYHTRADAKKALRRHRGKGFDRRVRPYKCPDCGFFHLGHMPGVVRAGMATADEFYGRAETA